MQAVAKGSQDPACLQAACKALVALLATLSTHKQLVHSRPDLRSVRKGGQRRMRMGAGACRSRPFSFTPARDRQGGGEKERVREKVNLQVGPEGGCNGAYQTSSSLGREKEWEV